MSRWGLRWGSRWGGRWGSIAVVPAGRLLSASWSSGPYSALWEAASVIKTDFYVLKGETVTFRFTASPAVNITGWTLAMYVSRDAEARGGTSGTPLVTAAGSIVTVGSGIFDVPLTSDQTKTTLGTGRWRYDVWRTDTGNETPLAGGIIQIGTAARW